MLVTGGIPPRPAPPCVKPRVSRKPLSGVNTFPLHLIQISNFPVFTLSMRRNGLFLFDQNNHRNGETVVLYSRRGFEDDDEFDVDDDDFEDDNGDFEDDDDLNVIIPGEELDDWLKRKKPRGFGEGKVYYTSIEDELLEEIEHRRRAQLANINKLKSLSLEPQKKFDKDAGAVSTGVCVRISHLPKKRNIHRDLKAAFKGISGIVNILPVVFGNKKTKEPICKGLAFVNFNSLEDANKFIDIFSIQNITFGKINKRIKCEIVDSANVGGKGKAVDSVDKSGLFLLDKEDDFGEEDDGIRESAISSSASELDDVDRIEQKMKSSLDSLPSKCEDNPRAAIKVKSSPQKKKEKKNTMAKIPGAAKRLKLREKAMLADVFSRYGSGVTSVSKES